MEIEPPSPAQDPEPADPSADDDQEQPYREPSARREPRPDARPDPGGNPRIILRSEHQISRKNISDETLKVLYRLHELGYKGYLVGGGVRDLYLGKEPKDFDIGTDARPSRLKKIFRNCRIIGRRFRIAHVYFPGNKIVEVATFRRGEVHSINKPSGVILIDNQYGTPEEDAKRRDITINGLFYDIGTYAIIDYVGGVDDLNNRIVRTIQDPDGSFKEDPVRMVRALRHAARTGFQVEENTLQAIHRNRHELLKANPSRLMEEMFKDLRGGAAAPFFQKLLETRLLETFLPTLAGQLCEHGSDHPLPRRLRALDRLSVEGQEFPNPTMVSVLLHTLLVPDPDAWVYKPGLGNPKGVWGMMQKGWQEIGKHLRVSRRDQEKSMQSLLAYLKVSSCIHKGDLSATYQKKTYLGGALEFAEIDFVSTGGDPALIRDWRQNYVPPPEPKEDFPFLQEDGRGEPRGDGAGNRGRRRRRRGGRGRSRSDGAAHQGGDARQGGTAPQSDAHPGDAHPGGRRRGEKHGEHRSGGERTGDSARAASSPQAEGGGAPQTGAPNRQRRRRKRRRNRGGSGDGASAPQHPRVREG